MAHSLWGSATDAQRQGKALFSECDLRKIAEPCMNQHQPGACSKPGAQQKEKRRMEIRTTPKFPHL